MSGSSKTPKAPPNGPRTSGPPLGAGAFREGTPSTEADPNAAIPGSLRPRICPPELFEASLSGRLVVFAGSGVSQPTERPGWHELVKGVVAACTSEMADDPRIRSLNSLLRRNAEESLAEETLEFLKTGFDADKRERVKALLRTEADPAHLKAVMDVLKEAMGQEAFHRRICAVLDHSGSQPTCMTHQYLVNLRPHAIVTTNYDDCFEECLTSGRHRWSTKSVARLDERDESHPHEQTVYHLHGCVTEPDSLVTGTREYELCYQPSGAATRLLDRIFTRYVVLFVGFSFRDEQVLARLVAYPDRQKHLAVVAPESSEHRLLEALGVRCPPLMTRSDPKEQSRFDRAVATTLCEWTKEISNAGREEAG